MSTLQYQWREYRDKVYPEGIPARQNLECHQAFFAGALVALQMVNGVAGLSEDEAIKALRALANEANEICFYRSETLEKGTDMDTNDKPAEKPWTDLGYMNGWYNGNPLEYDQCRAAKHQLRGATIGRCVSQTWCDTCRLTWKCDSSD